MLVSRAPTPFAAVATLGLTQIVGYGTLFYSFSILAPDMARDLGLSSEEIFTIFSVALLAAGLTAPLLGGWMDRFGAARMMTIGSALAALTLALCAWSPAPPFFVAGIVAIQVASGLVQYQAAFATLVERAPHGASRSITYLTLIAGFASTAFWPITTMLASTLDWRQVYLVFAGLNLLLCLPAHAALARKTTIDEVEQASTEPAHSAVVGVVAPEERRRAMILVLVAFALSGFALSSVLIHMVPIFGALGLGAAAVTIGSVFGPAQVASRVVNMIFGDNLPPTWLAMLSSALISLGGITLAVSGGSLAGAFVFAIAAGLGSGVGSIAQGAVPLYLFGSKGYGAVAGKITSARLVAGAAAPALFAIGIERLGIPTALVLNSALGAFSILGFALVMRNHTRQK